MLLTDAVSKLFLNRIGQIEKAYIFWNQDKSVEENWKCLTKDKVIRSENLTKGPRPHGIHSSGLQVHQHSPRNILSPCGLIIVDVDSFQLQVRVSVVGSGGVDTVFIRNYLPKLKFKHVDFSYFSNGKKTVCSSSSWLLLK